MVLVMLRKKTYCLSILFVFLILSIGLASANSPLSNTMAYAKASKEPKEPNYDTATLKITTKQRANCYHHDCPSIDGKVVISSFHAGIEKQFYPETNKPGGTAHFEIELPVDQTYVIAGSGFYKLEWIWTFEGEKYSK